MAVKPESVAASLGLSLLVVAVFAARNSVRETSLLRRFVQSVQRNDVNGSQSLMWDNINTQGASFLIYLARSMGQDFTVERREVNGSTIMLVTKPSQPQKSATYFAWILIRRNGVTKLDGARTLELVQRTSTFP